MDTKMTFRHMDHSDVIRDYANGQLAKVYEFLSNEKEPIHIDLTFEASKVHAHHRVELRITSPQFHLITHEEGPEFYKLIDYVVDTMYRLLHEEKRKEVDERKTQGKRRI